MKRVFLKDIAKDLNVSKTTVSLVLNNKGDENKISQDTQQKIIAYAKEHSYVPNQLARGLSRGKSETIGLVIPNISDIFYARIAGFIERKAKKLGYTVIFSSSYEDPKKEGELIQSMLNRQVDGLIIASTQQNREEIQSLKANNFPFVLIDRHYPDSETDYVIVDNFEGTKKATAHLLSLGRRKIGFVTLKPGLEVIRQRLLGYQKALEIFGIAPIDELVHEVSRENYKEETVNGIKQLVQFPNAVDAIVFATHYLTAAGLRELKRLNIKVPQEVAIVSFDELEAFDLTDPAITAVTQPAADIGNVAVDILMDKIRGDAPPTQMGRVLDIELAIRRSCGSV
ncbi:LacI family transcriptional regulator [Muricauda sp. SCSIO 64092]|uniref:LacI family DNA-binding transcriptional regulator n=1 Tax=Allomuricauda sp. SCSIO 64092 TaxID=2908842 RepID=UPI001FF39F51|nr:LacI family DNA-binding transcriptional regulator [Muricauda sp. SCSIO 64092]UOY05881.1 LacI family transcriptional regulator [Muricauda sp. SCSIO 64092]